MKADPGSRSHDEITGWNMNTQSNHDKTIILLYYIG